MSLLALLLVPVIVLHADRPATLDKVDLPALPGGYQWITCVRDDFDKTGTLRCYGAHAETMDLMYADFTPKQ